MKAGSVRRRELVAAGLAGLAWGACGWAGSRGTENTAVPAKLEWLPAWRIRELVVRKHLSAVEVTQYFLDRIERLDGSIGAFAQVDTRGALEAARRADQSLRRGETPGPLHGVPVSLKQMIAVRGMTLETGDNATTDSVVVDRIRRAGGIVLGTTVLAGPPAMLGDVVPGAANPWNTGRVAGASSSGSGSITETWDQGSCPF